MALSVHLFGFNPLNQVYVFNHDLQVCEADKCRPACFNPLNQVYVFNLEKDFKRKVEKLKGFNPLNQVYVFNMNKKEHEAYLAYKKSFNPLNQVYVFNINCQGIY